MLKNFLEKTPNNMTSKSIKRYKSHQNMRKRSNKMQ